MCDHLTSRCQEAITQASVSASPDRVASMAEAMQAEDPLNLFQPCNMPAEVPVLPPQIAARPRGTAMTACSQEPRCFSKAEAGTQAF